MREIKFRGKTKKGKEWIYGVPIQWCDGGWQICGTYTRYTVDENTIGQFTGLKDKNGVEIYEGDIVKWTEDIGNNIYRTLRDDVLYADGRFYPLNDQIIDVNKLPYVQVIGNIYDNKELIENETDK